MSRFPVIGMIVRYKLDGSQANQINKRRGDFIAAAPQSSGLAAHVGNAVQEEDIFPAMIVRVWGTEIHSSVNLQVFLDGNDTFWATSVNHARQSSQYHDPYNMHPVRTYI